MSQQSFLASPCSRADLRLYANQIRKMFQLDKEKCFPILEFTEFILPKFYPDFVLEICDTAKMGNSHGETYPDKNRIIIREDVYIGATNDVGRDRFTIAHEVGHFLLHRGDSVTMARMKPGTKIITYRDPEWQADAFAGELLIPAHLVRGMSAYDVSMECKVSYRAATIQLSKL